ncbi:MAG: putative toxin-antitoxin system toxin component, PIN family [Nitrososphaerales archaeon]
MKKERVRVLLDTNILISGLVFANGNEHKILRLIAAGSLSLVLPETVLLEAKKVLNVKFEGMENLLNLYLDKIDFELVLLEDVLRRMNEDSGKVRDKKDAPIYSAAVTSKPDYVMTGDHDLRVDLTRSPEPAKNTMICSSREFLRMYLDPH